MGPRRPAESLTSTRPLVVEQIIPAAGEARKIEAAVADRRNSTGPSVVEQGMPAA